MLKRTRLHGERHVTARLSPRGTEEGLTLGQKRCRSSTHHEAAHAVIAQLEGLEIEGVRVDPVAKTYFRRGQTFEQTSGVISYAIALYAGGLGSKRSAPFSYIGDEKDMQLLREALKLLDTPSERKRVRVLAAMRARGAVSKHWPAIVKLANRVGREGAVLTPNDSSTSRTSHTRSCMRGNAGRSLARARR